MLTAGPDIAGALAERVLALVRGFLLVADYSPPNLQDLVTRARTIAEADHFRYTDVFAKEGDGTNMGQLGFIDT